MIMYCETHEKTIFYECKCLRDFRETGPWFLLERIVIVMHTSDVKCIPKIIVPTRNLKIFAIGFKVLKEMFK